MSITRPALTSTSAVSPVSIAVRRRRRAAGSARARAASSFFTRVLPGRRPRAGSRGRARPDLCSASCREAMRDPGSALAPRTARALELEASGCRGRAQTCPGRRICAGCCSLEVLRPARSSCAGPIPARSVPVERSRPGPSLRSRSGRRRELASARRAFFAVVFAWPRLLRALRPSAGRAFFAGALLRRAAAFLTAAVAAGAGRRRRRARRRRRRARRRIVVARALQRARARPAPRGTAPRCAAATAAARSAQARADASSAARRRAPPSAPAPVAGAEPQRGEVERGAAALERGRRVAIVERAAERRGLGLGERAPARRARASRARRRRAGAAGDAASAAS